MHAHSLIDVGFLLSTVLCQGHSVSPHTCIVLICHAVSQCGLLMQVKVLSVKCALYAEVHAKGMVKNITYDQALLLFCFVCLVLFFCPRHGLTCSSGCHGLTMWSRQAWNPLRSSCLCLLITGIRAMHHYSQHHYQLLCACNFLCSLWFQDTSIPYA